MSCAGYVSITTAARRTGHHPRSLRRWASSGDIEGATRASPRSPWRIPRAWLETQPQIDEAARLRAQLAAVQAEAAQLRAELEKQSAKSDTTAEHGEGETASLVA